MNLNDKEILELNDLCNGLADGTLSEKQKKRLCDWLAASEEARRYYIRAASLSASLASYASEMQVEAPDAATSPGLLRTILWWLSPLTAAALVILSIWFWTRPHPQAAAPELKSEEFVARLTASKECQWKDGSSIRPNEYLRKGQRLELAKGLAEITFDSGALLILEGPASLDLNSAWDATLVRGTLKASVPSQAMGFRISNPSVEVVDLGTEFTMIADGSGAADVLVLRGMVEASPHDPSGQRTIVLHENQSRHFARSGISNVSNSEEKFARSNQQLALDHLLPATAFVHWSFDEVSGDVLRADAFGQSQTSYDAHLNQVSDNVLPSIHTEGRWGRALRFNGHLYAKADFAGISGKTPHTVAFWVKVPEDAQLPNAYAMVAWSAESKNLGSHPVHIGWNRNPTEGTVGVLRTDYGGGFALGATPLRDGRWHHVAIIFVPGEDAATPAEVKQYVDGRFEGEGKPSPPGTQSSTRSRDENATLADTLWLGCRLGNDGPRKDRFRGEMDELCVADRALAPREIVLLLKENKPMQTDLAALRK